MILNKDIMCGKMENKETMENQSNKGKVIFLHLYVAEEPDLMNIDFVSKEKAKNETESQVKEILVLKAEDSSLGHNSEAEICISGMFKIKNESIFDVNETVEKIIMKNGHSFFVSTNGELLKYWENIQKQVLGAFKEVKMVDFE